jgi:MarR family transcriptional regulator, transcriptional regulator for hemolysin
MRPPQTPIGLHLTQASRAIGRAFDDALTAAGGSLPAWLVLINLKMRRVASQRELAEAMGITDATLTHHLNAMETAGLVTRHRDPANRRVHVVEMTPAGESAFLALREAAMSFDKQLRRGVSAAEVAGLADLLDRLAANVSGRGSDPPWAGLAEKSS